MPAGTTATGLGLALLTLVARDPGLGVAAVVLASGFLLGEYKTPYFLLGHALALATILSALARRRARSEAHTGAALWPVLLFLLVTVLALPLDLRTLLEELWLGRWLDWRAILARGLDRAALKPLERIGVLALGAGLFTVAARFAPVRPRRPRRRPPGRGRRRAGGVWPVPVLRDRRHLRTVPHALLLDMGASRSPAHRRGGNPDYFAQFLALTVPIVMTLAWRPGAAAPRRLGGVAATVGILALVFTFQRAAYAALLVALGTLGVLRARGPADEPRGWWKPIVGGAIGALLVVAVIDHVLVDGRVAGRLARFATDPNRLTLWDAAFRMFATHPLLGVGTGRYAYFFREYADPKALRGFGPFWGTAHSTYLQLLAEQGVLGLVAFLVCFGHLWLRALRGLAGLPDDRRLSVEGLVASFAGWFVYAAVQYVFRVDALLYLVFVLAGWLAGLIAPLARPAPRPAVRRVAGSSAPWPWSSSWRGWRPGSAGRSLRATRRASIAGNVSRTARVRAGRVVAPR